MHVSHTFDVKAGNCYLQSVELFVKLPSDSLCGDSCPFLSITHKRSSLVPHFSLSLKLVTLQ